MQHIRKVFCMSRRKIHFPAFLTSLLVYFIIIIFICTLIMGVLSYRVIGSFITKRTISSNNTLLNQYRDSIDSILVETIIDISSEIVYDVNTNYYLKSYFNNPLEGRLADIYNISMYLGGKSVSNPLIHSLTIYYGKNNLLVSTDYIRHTLYKELHDQKEIIHYRGIIQKVADERPEGLALVLDNEQNINLNEYKLWTGRTTDDTVVHAVRLIYGRDRSVNGAVIATIGGNVLKDVLNRFVPEDLGSIFIIGNENLIISHTDSRYIGRNVSELEYGGMLSEIYDKSSYFIADVESVPAVISCQKSECSDWIYVSVAPMEAISSMANHILKIVAFIALLSILIGLLISIPAARKIAKPIQAIASYCMKSPYIIEIEGKNGRNECTLISNTINKLENIMEEKEKELKEMLPMLKMNFLSALLSSAPPKLAEIEARMKMLNIDFPNKYFCAAAIKLERLQNSEKVVMYEYEKLNILLQLESIFTTASSTCIFYEKDNIITVLFNFDFTEEYLYQLGMRFLNNTVNQDCENISISKYLSFGKTDMNIQNMGHSFKLALSGLNYCYIFPDRNLFTYDDINNWEKKSSFMNILHINSFLNSLKSLRRENSILNLREIICCLRNENLSFEHIQATLITCVSIVEDFISSQTSEDIDLEQGYKNTNNIYEFEAWLKEVIYNIFNTLGEKASNGMSDLIQRALAFIVQNIKNDQLSLSYVAEKLGVSHKYLSKAFKNETGVKFIDYITNLKLNHCSNLLINTDLKVEEISDIIGYSTPQYFISRFKMTFGCTPNKYRQKYAKNCSAK